MDLKKQVARNRAIVIQKGRSQTKWTNFWPILTTYLPIMDFRGHLVHYLPLVHVDIEKHDHLPPMYNMYLVLQLLLSRRRWAYTFQVFLGLLTNPISIHKQKLPSDVKNIWTGPIRFNLRPTHRITCFSLLIRNLYLWTKMNLTFLWTILLHQAVFFSHAS